MAKSFVPFRTSPSSSLTDNLNVINLNFDQVAESIDDFGNQTGTLSGSFAIFPAGSAGNVQYLQVLADAGTFTQDSVLFDPKFSYRIDVDHPDYQFPDGVALSGFQLSMFFGPPINSLTPPSGQQLETIVAMRSGDPVDVHQIFVTGTVKVYTAPPEGVFR